MIMTKTAARIGLAFSLLGPCAAQVKEVQPPTLERLIETMQDREKAVTSASMEMETTGSFPGGVSFKTKGTIRVLGETHIHIVVHSDFGPEMRVETETLVTPDGVWTRERDPVQGEIYTHMDPALLSELRAASRVLGEELSLPGLSGGPAKGPQGSNVLKDLSAQFDLVVGGPVTVADQSCWSVAGPIRADASADGVPGYAPDRMEILVRRQDLVLVRMTQLTAGKPINEVRISRIELNLPMAPSSFMLEIEPRGKPIDVMDHPPMRDQILRIFGEAETQGWQRQRSEPVIDPEVNEVPPATGDKKGKKH